MIGRQSRSKRTETFFPYSTLCRSRAREAYRAAASLASAEASPVWADGPSAAPLAFADGSSGDADDDQHDLDLALGPDAGLAARLCPARATAEAVRTADPRTRSPPYRSLDHPSDFAPAPEDRRGVVEGKRVSRLVGIGWRG